MNELSQEKRALLDRLLKQKGLDVSRLPIARRPKASESPALSFSQERMWFLNQLDPASSAYNLTFNVGFSKQLDHDVVQRTLDELMRRHEILRTTYRSIDGRLVQQIASTGTCPAEFIDLRKIPETEQNDEIKT